MKLRNKKTGEIVDLSEGFITDTYGGEKIQIKPVAISNKEGYVYSSLAELNDEWEDAPEEPKGFWSINGDVTIEHFDKLNENDLCKKIGNYFETKEEAELVVRKLKAWKRLKDKGFRFEGIAGICNQIYFKANKQFTHIMVDEYTADKTEKEYIDDLMLLFGGEE